MTPTCGSRYQQRWVMPTASKTFFSHFVLFMLQGWTVEPTPPHPFPLLARSDNAKKKNLRDHWCGTISVLRAA
ncbi:hypothetical protein BgiMline_011617 [Biomphalaria glabrata]